LELLVVSHLLEDLLDLMWALLLLIHMQQEMHLLPEVPVVLVELLETAESLEQVLLVLLVLPEVPEVPAVLLMLVALWAGMVFWQEP
jgi:hypothetical protein